MKRILLTALIIGLFVTVLTQLTPPVMPTGLRSAIGDTQTTLVWNANSDKDLASYYIYGGTSPNPTDILAIVHAPATSYLHTGLDNGTTYYYRITAVDGMGSESVPTADITSIPTVTARPAITSAEPLTPLRTSSSSMGRRIW